jgi:hypothetical protein
MLFLCLRDEKADGFFKQTVIVWKKGYHRRILANALPDGLFKYASKSRAFCQSVKAMAVLIRHGLNFDVWGFLQPFVSLLYFEANSGRGERI